MSSFDYIIIGAGAAGLMLADAMGKDAFFKKKSILLLDKDTKRKNDRTWCFWERGQGPFDDIVHKTWHQIFFGGQHFSKGFSIAPYSYKMIRSLDFYASFLKRVQANSNVTFLQETVETVEQREGLVEVLTDKTTHKGKQVFNSIFDYKMVTRQNKYPVLQQHFLGWFVKTEKPVFKPNLATYMDFSIAQQGNTRFMYVLPFSQKEALVEYTLFSEHLLPKKEYGQAIRDYLINNLASKDFEVLGTEYGNIPMTCYDFSVHNRENLLHIGTAGGWAKASTGYTFMSTAKKIPKVIQYLKTGKSLEQLHFKNRFWFYDLLLLDILHRDNHKGQLIFETLFRNRPPQDIFKFLDEETTLWEEIRIMKSSPALVFLKALGKRIF